jgi:hypothetical protein
MVLGYWKFEEEQVGHAAECPKSRNCRYVFSAKYGTQSAVFFIAIQIATFLIEFFHCWRYLGEISKNENENSKI